MLNFRGKREEPLQSENEHIPTYHTHTAVGSLFDFIISISAHYNLILICMICMQFVVRRPFCSVCAVSCFVACSGYSICVFVCLPVNVDKLHANGVEYGKKQICLQIALCIFNEINKIHIKTKSVLNHN